MEILIFLEKWIWLGLAAVGFAILFNVPVRTLWIIFVLGSLGGAIKLIALKMGMNIVLSSFFGAVLVGFLSIWSAHLKHSPPFVFAIPAVIPMVPGAFAYRMMLGIIQLTGEMNNESFVKILEESVNNGLKAFFVLLALALGVSAPMLLTRRESAKDIKIKLKIDEIVKKK